MRIKSIKGSVLDKIYFELKESPYPVFIWGAGSMSVEVEKCLKEQGIPIKGFFVNIDKENIHIIPREDKIYSIEEIQNKYNKINVVMGHGHFEKRYLLEKYSVVNKIYIIPNPYLQYRSKGIGEYIKDHKSEIENIVDQLADDLSREALEAYCCVNESDDIDYLLNKEFCINGMFDFEKLKLTNKENYIDVGAWEGDTIASFLEKTSEEYAYIGAIEPDPDSFSVLREKMKDRKNIQFFPYGVGKEEGILFLNGIKTQSAYLSKEKKEMDKGVEIKIKTLDSLFLDKRISLLKVSIPFLFLLVLQGCEQCLKRDRPRLLVNVAADDGVKIFDTIKWVLDLKMDYKIALRFDFPMPTRLYMYAY